MAPRLTPPPLKIPQKLLDDPEMEVFISTLVTSVYQMFFAMGGNVENSGIPTIDFRVEGDLGAGIASTLTLTGATDTPTVDPGWADSSTTDMNVPDGYIKIYRGTQAAVIPTWNT